MLALNEGKDKNRNRRRKRTMAVMTLAEVLEALWFMAGVNTKGTTRRGGYGPSPSQKTELAIFH